MKKCRFWFLTPGIMSKAAVAAMLSLSCLALASCGDGGKELLSGELTSDGSMGRARLVRPGAQRLQSFCQEDE